MQKKYQIILAGLLVAFLATITVLGVAGSNRDKAVAGIKPSASKSSHLPTNDELLARAAAQCKRVPACEWFNTSGLSDSLKPVARDLGELYKDEQAGYVTGYKAQTDIQALYNDVTAAHDRYPGGPYRDYHVHLEDLWVYTSQASDEFFQPGNVSGAFYAVDQARNAFVAIYKYYNEVYAQGADPSSRQAAPDGDDPAAASPAPQPSNPPAASTVAPHAGATSTRIVSGGLSGKSYTVRIRARDRVDCDGNSYGPIGRFLASYPCTADRILGTAAVHGRTAVFSVIAANFRPSEGDQYGYGAARRFADVERASGTGSINDLLRAGHHIPGVARAIPAHEVFTVDSQDAGVWLFDAWWARGSTTDRDPQLVALEKGLDLSNLFSRD